MTEPSRCWAEMRLLYNGRLKQRNKQLFEHSEATIPVEVWCYPFMTGQLWSKAPSPKRQPYGNWLLSLLILRVVGAPIYSLALGGQRVDGILGSKLCCH
jgi:hypothetical protein